MYIYTHIAPMYVEIMSALLGRGVHASDTHAVLQELHEEKGRIRVQGVGCAEQFAFSSGGKQGGVETPDLFNILMEHILSPLIRQWNK